VGNVAGDGNYLFRSCRPFVAFETVQSNVELRVVVMFCFR
jgi:hypothetical protein